MHEFNGKPVELSWHNGTDMPMHIWKIALPAEQERTSAIHTCTAKAASAGLESLVYGYIPYSEVGSADKLIACGVVCICKQDRYWKSNKA